VQHAAPLFIYQHPTFWKRTMKLVEALIERLLWYSRLIVIVPVVFSLLLSFALFITTTVDAMTLLGLVPTYLSSATEQAVRDGLRLTIIGQIVGAIDGYLIAAILLIFALGLYELFINKIKIFEESEFAQRILVISSFDDLKDRLANVVQVVLVVKFFQQALRLKYESPVDILVLAVGILAIGLSLFFTRKKALRSEQDKGGDY
jgi:uncharacterized membrane protein YqhA